MSVMYLGLLEAILLITLFVYLFLFYYLFVCVIDHAYKSFLYLHMLSNKKKI